MPELPWEGIRLVGVNDPGEMRISDADREAAAKRLHDALGEGRITLTELEERLDAVYAARTASELRPPLADLPGSELVAPRTGELVRPADGADRVHLRTGAGTVKRTGDWQVPAAMKLTTSMGTIHLDLSEVRQVPPRIDIEVSTGMGEIVLVLPEGGSADVDAVSGSWGEVKTKVPSTPGGSGPHIVVHGKVGMGSLTVRGSRKGWWKAVMG
ncbi:hypothetical protein PSA01_40340 [Pseudonocardia saturnea]|uniref:DUF1707 domain-containing protein n=1 Tax=Pseudonocardia saturnea TaxID=33909 RepID=A0ABQ0S264_9PSEU|nr:hypothetical protein Pdca_18300 [Pseudonocardia autotrophica]GEC27005.1 hypothetical protein PSA01_40340 [Pseudonocardia saturnea]